MSNEIQKLKKYIQTLPDEIDDPGQVIHDLSEMISRLPSESPSPPMRQDDVIVEDLQKQVRDHIKAHDLFDWHEALTENEMIYLENMLLTFAPMFSPGSIGFEKTVRPYLKSPSSQPPMRLREVIELLEGVREYMDNKADADYENEQYRPNKEMGFLSDIESVLPKLKSTPAKD